MPTHRNCICSKVEQDTPEAFQTDKGKVISSSHNSTSEKSGVVFSSPAVLFAIGFLTLAQGREIEPRQIEGNDNRQQYQQPSSLSSEYLLSFQADGSMSNETYASYTGQLSHMDQLTICYWFNLHYHHTTISLASYCAPASNCTSVGRRPTCSNIQYHVENKKWDEFRVEFSLNAVKTKSLRATVNPKSWTHHCLTYKQNDGTVKMFSGGSEQSSAVLSKGGRDAERPQHPDFTGEGILILGQEQERICGGFDDYDSLSADLSEFQIWNRILSPSEIRSLSTCQSFAQGNVISWREVRNRWNLSHIDLVQGDRAAQSERDRSRGTVRAATQGLSREFCRSLAHEKFFVVFPERRSLDGADDMCKVHGGHLPVPRNFRENRVMAELGKTYEAVCSEDGKENLNQPYMWLGLDADSESGRWMDRRTGLHIRWQHWDEDEGSEGDTCARMLGNGRWRDTVCKKSVRHCTACHIINPQQAFTLRGLCQESHIDRGYFLVNGRVRDVNRTRMKPIYEGSFSKIEWVFDSEDFRSDANGMKLLPGVWKISSRIPYKKKKLAYWAITNATSQLGYPVGRHLWLVRDPKCDLFEPTWMNLTLSRCGEAEFTCADGSCIEAHKRCDLVQHCKDFSDELACDTVIVPSTYLQNPPTDPNSPDRPVGVILGINILNIDKIDTVNMMFAVTMEVSMEWKDHRLKYKNLREGLGQNQLTPQEIDKIWRPQVTFTNAKIGQLEMTEMGHMVRRQSEPEEFTYTSPIEDKIYSGSSNSLVIVRKVYAEYGCTFDLRDFPFDDQRCTMNFTMDSAKANYIVLYPEEINYQGEILLLEFFIKKIAHHPEPLVTKSGKSMVSVYIMFHRELGNMVNTYFQTFLLCLMAYLTLYINLADFGNRFMGALTSLLVLASLLASIEENLPKTSYFKKIDVWFMSYIIFIFVIIVFHICVDFCAGHCEEVLENSDTHIMARTSKVGATYLNNWGKIIFPIVLIVFTTLYFVLSLISTK